MKQETFNKAYELQLLILNLKENKDILVNRINFQRHTNTESYHELTVKIEQEITKSIESVFNQYITQFQNEFDQL